MARMIIIENQKEDLSNLAVLLLKKQEAKAY